MGEMCVVYITAADHNEALRLGRALVSERLAACVNVLGPISAIYWWDGAVQEGAEVALLAKTRLELVDELGARVRALHSYACPCVVAWPIAAGSRSFLDWIAAETGTEVRDAGAAP